MAWMGHAVEPSAMPGMATDEQLDELATATGADADELFVELMTAHHQGGIDMATDAAERAENDDVAPVRLVVGAEPAIRDRRAGRTARRRDRRHVGLSRPYTCR